MCSDNPNLPKEANKAKCFVIACFVFSIFSMIGFAAGIPGIIGALCGILACIGSSILMCCAPSSVEEGNGKFTAASVLLFIAGIIQLIMGIVVIASLIVALNEVNDSLQGIVVFIFGISAAFLFVAGILNTLGGVYCLKANAAIKAMPACGTAVPMMQTQATVVPVQAGTMVAPQ